MTCQAGTRCYSVVEKVWKNMEGNKYKVVSSGKCEGHRGIVRDMVKIRAKQAQRGKINEEVRLKLYGGSREGVRMKTHLHGASDYAKSWICYFGYGTWTSQKERGTPLTG